MYTDDSQDYKIAVYLYDTIKDYAPSAIPKSRRRTPESLQKWCDDIRRLRQHLKETEPTLTDHDIGRLINYVKDDAFWPTVIHSASSFRTNFPKIKAKYDLKQRGASSNGKGNQTSRAAAYSAAKVTVSASGGEVNGILPDDPDPNQDPLNGTSGTIDEQRELPPGMCPKCGPWGGLGYIKVIDEHGPDSSWPHHYRIDRCACMADEDKNRSRKVAKELSDFTGKMQLMTFDAFQRDWQPDAYQSAWTFASDPRGWLFLYSPPGCGKTHLLAAIANHLLDTGHKALYVIVPDMLQHIRDGFNVEAQRLHEDASQRLQHIRTTEVLLLDDLGAEKSSEWAVEQMYMILDYRYREELPTVIASNLTAETLPPSMIRISDRLRDARKCQSIRLRGKSYRKFGKGEKQQ